MRTRGFGASDPGRERESNEDSYFIDDELGLYVVCDGMGGHQAGEVASALAIEAVVEVVRARQPAVVQLPNGDWDSAPLVEATQDAVNRACQVVYETASSDRSKAGMGCTLTTLLTSGPKAVMGHVGDTRLYLLREGAGHQLSTDHTMAAEFARMGVIRPENVKTHHLAHVLTRAIGPQPAVQVDLLPLDLMPGDLFIVCSDGLSDYLSDSQGLAERARGAGLEELPGALVAFANESGGRDNTTVVAIRVEEEAVQAAIVGTAEDTKQQIHALAAAPIFDEDFFVYLLRLVDAADVRDYQNDEVVLSEGQTLAAIYVPIQGQLRVASSGGRSYDVGRGEVLGETSLFRPRKALAAVTAVGSCRVLVLDAEGLRKLIRRHPWFGIGVLERLATHLSQRLDARQTLPPPEPVP